MFRDRTRYDRRLFVAAAGWNIAIALPFLLAEAPLRALLQLPPPADPMISQLFFLAVLALGIGYGLVARDPGRNDGIVVVGILVKLAVFGVIGAYWQMGTVGAMAMLAPCGDLLFAAAFTEFLMSRHERAA